MKTINYTGSSKLISRIVNLLNRRAPLPLDGDGDPDWGTNGQFLTTDGAGGTTWSSGGGGGDTVSWTQTQASGTKIAEIDINGTSQNVYVPTAPTVNDGTLTIQQNGTTVGTFSANQSGDTTVNLTGGGSSGHTIWNRIKTALTARGKLWFADASVSDVSVDDATKVEVVTELQSESAFDNLATDGTADGIYTFPDSGGEYLTAEMVGYGNTDVKTALDGKVSKSGDTISGNLNVTGNLQKNGTNVLLAGGAVTRTQLWYVFETQCNPGSSVANPLVTYSALSQYDEIHIEVGVGSSGDSKQTGSEIISKEMLSIMNTYGSVVYHTTNAAGIANNTFYKTGFFVQLSGGSLILGNHTQGYAYNYMRIRVEGIKYN